MECVVQSTESKCEVGGLVYEGLKGSEGVSGGHVVLVLFLVGSVLGDGKR